MSAWLDCREIDTNRFNHYLQEQLTSKKDATYVYNLSMQYAYVLSSGDAKDILTLTTDKRRQVMRALAHLAKFNGIYEQWLQIKRNYRLKWQGIDNKFTMFDAPDISRMLAYMHDVKAILPERYYNVFAYATITGLRASEAFKSIELIKTNLDTYYNKEKGILEHYKFKDIFLRSTKKAYISIVTPEIIEIAKSAEGSYNAIDKYLQRRGKETKLGYGRKIFATTLHDKGIPTEIVDLLQGRISASIFARHYYRPDFNSYADKIRTLLPYIFCKALSS